MASGIHTCTNTHIHTYLHESDFKKPGTCRLRPARDWFKNSNKAQKCQTICMCMQMYIRMHCYLLCIHVITLCMLSFICYIAASLTCVCMYIYVCDPACENWAYVNTKITPLLITVYIYLLHCLRF